MLDQRLLAAAVTVVHAADLRDRHVALVDEEDPLARVATRHLPEVVHQAVATRASGAPVHVPRVVLDARACARLGEKLEVVVGAAEQALRLEQLALRLQREHLFLELRADRLKRALHLVLRHHVVHGGEDVDARLRREHLAGDWIESLDTLDLAPEELDADRVRLRCRPHLYAVSADPVPAALRRSLVARVLHAREREQEAPALERRAALDHGHPVAVLVGRPKAVDAGHAGHHDGVGAAEQVARGREPESVEVLVPRRVLLDVDVALRDVRLGLVVVVVGDEVAHRMAREELAHLLEELRGERLVVAHDERGPARVRDDAGHRERLAGAGRAKQRLPAVSRLDAAHKMGDRLRLVAGRLERAAELEGRAHGP